MENTPAKRRALICACIREHRVNMGKSEYDTYRDIMFFVKVNDANIETWYSKLFKEETNENRIKEI